ncbi:MAG: alpha/beta hydrolase family protein [Candidatus Helarchaeota archaeon]
MLSKYLVPFLIGLTILFWLLSLFILPLTDLFHLLQTISFSVLLLYLGVLLGMGFFLITEYLGIEYSHLLREPFELTLADGVTLHGQILTTQQMDSSTPVVLACHGWGGSMEQLEQITFPLIVQGYKVVVYNHRGHGKKPFKSGGNKSELIKTIQDVHQVIDFIEARSDLNHQKLAAIGFSLGGTVVLTEGYIDARCKLLIAFCAPHDWYEMNKYWSWYVRLFFRLTRLPVYPAEAVNRQLSPKYFLTNPMEHKVVCLAHAMNDRVTPYEGFLKNRELLNLPEAQILVFKRGDHGFTGQNTVYTSQVIKWLREYL